MRRNELDRITDFYRFDPSPEIVIGSQKVAFHHTVQRPDYSSMTYGGLHDTRDGAKQARANFAENARKTRWGAGFKSYTHGVDDCTHDSTNKG